MTVTEVAHPKHRHHAERLSDAFVHLVCVQRTQTFEEVFEEFSEGVVRLTVLNPASLSLEEGDLDLLGFGHPTASLEAMVRLYKKMEVFRFDKKPFCFLADGPDGRAYAGRIDFLSN